MSTMMSTAFADLLDPAFRKIIEDTFKEKPPIWPSIFNKGKSGKNIEKDSMVSGFGRFPVKNEAETGFYDQIYQGYDTTYTHKTYWLGFRVARELYDDDQFMILKRMPKALARAAQASYDLDAAKVFDYGFTALGSIGAANKWMSGSDAAALFSTAHPSTAGYANRSNVASPAADLSVSSLKAALINLELTKDSRGLPKVVTPKKLIVHPNDRFIASELLNSANMPGTANNDDNSIKREYKLEMIVNPYLSDTDAWFVVCDEHELNMMEREPFNFERDKDFDALTAKFCGWFRYSFGYSDWVGTWASAGA